MLAAMLLAGEARAATFVVTTTADAGAGSLRQAILDANADAVPDTIAFAVPTAGVPHVAPASVLPTVTQPVTIDGTTQTPSGLVELSGAGALTYGLVLAGTGITVRGLVVNGFTSAEIRITGSGNVVEGTLVGPDASGTTSATPTSATGIAVVSAGGNRIGGWDASARNLVSGNGTGIAFSGTAATPNVVVGNWIGTDVTGVAALPNAGAGIDSFLASAQTIGGLAPGAGNVVAGNGSDGLSVSGSDWVVQGNLVGVGADGITPVPNGRHGIRLFNTAARATVGVAGPNHVAYNKSAGILLAINASTGNHLGANVIHDNGALGIDISGTGVTPNDAGDADVGSNLGQNFPVLDAAFAGGATIAGTLDSTPGGTFTIELFANAACDPTGYGEGAEFLGSLVVGTDAAGHAAFAAALARPVLPSEFVTATATDANGNTSEFSRCAPDPLGTTTTTTSSTTTSSTSTSSSTTTLAPSSTTTTSTAAPTTSTTDPPTTTTSVPPSTTTSTSPPPTTTTTLLDPPPTTSSTLPEPPSTTSTTDPAPTSTSTAPASTSTSSTVADASTTSSTTPDASTTTSTSAPTTTTTLPDPPPTSTTTSSTSAESSTTTSTSLDPATSTSTTSAPPTTTSVAPATTTSTTDPTPTSTSTAPASTSTSSTVADASTTSSTTPDASTTTSTTGPPTTTTTTLPAPPPTSTTTMPDATTTTTTLDPTTTTTTTSTSTSTSMQPGSSTSTSSSSSTTTAVVLTTTSTTSLPDGGCGTALAFEPLRCRLDGLTASVADAPSLAPMREDLDRHLAKARRRLDGAALACETAKRAPARRKLRMVGRGLAALGKTLATRTVRRAVPRSVSDPLASEAMGLAADARAFARALACR